MIESKGVKSKEHNYYLCGWVVVRWRFNKHFMLELYKLSSLNWGDSGYGGMPVNPEAKADWLYN